MSTMTSVLERLAKSVPMRRKLLDARKARERSRSRTITCSTCDETGYSTRDPNDICDVCLVELWNAKDVVAGEFKRNKVDGTAYVMTNVAHWLEYPHLATRSEDVPDAFLRDRDRSSEDVLRRSYVDIITGLSKVLPVDPGSRDSAERFLPGQWSSHDASQLLYVRLPASTAKALQDFWTFFRWHSHEAYRQGFAAGHDLLSRMNLGDLTHEGFTEEIAEQTAALQERMKKIAGEKPARGRRR